MSVKSTAFEIETPEVEELSSSSSIGKNSDDEEVGSRSSASSDKDDEAQSRYSGRLFTMEELELVLPTRRGLSMFYDGKSKSFTSLVDASASSSVQEIVKPENGYARRRRNLLAFNRVWDKGQSCSPHRGNGTATANRGISKKPLRSIKSTLALVFALTNSERYSYSSTSDDSSSSNMSHSPPPAVHLPPVHPQSRESLNHHGSSNSHSWMCTPWPMANLHLHRHATIDHLEN